MHNVTERFAASLYRMRANFDHGLEMSKPKQWVRAVFAEECRLSSLLLRFSNPELFSESPVSDLILYIL